MAVSRRARVPEAYPDLFRPGGRPLRDYLVVAAVPAVILALLLAAHYQGMIHRPGDGWQSGVVHSVPLETKAVALTFDDGPDRHVTPPLLEVLREFDVRCTFFMAGFELERSPDTGRQVAAAGHEVANHAFSHLRLSGVPTALVESELDRAEKLFAEVLKVRPRLFRFPYLAYDAASLKTVQARGYTVIGCSLDSMDWGTRDPKAIARRVTSNIKPGDIVLMHDVGEPNREKTAAAVREILEYLKNNGYRCVTVSELLELAVQEERQKEGRD